MAKVELTPLRPWDDFFPGSERFAKPDGKDLAKWNNRVVSNLLYYQTNYLALAIVVFLIVGSSSPFLSYCFRYCRWWCRVDVTYFKRI